MKSPSKRRSRSTTKIDVPLPPPVTDNKQKVVLLTDEVAQCKTVQSVRLRHPCTGRPALFLIAKDNADTTHLAELNTFDEGNRSWFLGNTVLSDGKLYIATPYNPTYLILPYLMKCERNVPLEQLLEEEEEFPATVELASLAGDLSAVADRKGSADLNVWKYSEEKALQWLQQRTLQLSVRLQEKKVPTTTAQALTFVRTMTDDATKEAYLHLAHGLMSEYLCNELSGKLKEKLNLPEALRPKQKATTEGEGQPKSKKQKTSGPAEDYTKEAPVVKKVNTQVSAKARALAKSAVGNKSIMSFFGKK